MGERDLHNKHSPYVRKVMSEPFSLKLQNGHGCLQDDGDVLFMNSVSKAS